MRRCRGRRRPNQYPEKSRLFGNPAAGILAAGCLVPAFCRTSEAALLRRGGDGGLGSRRRCLLRLFLWLLRRGLDLKSGGGLAVIVEADVGVQSTTGLGLAVCRGFASAPLLAAAFRLRGRARRRPWLAALFARPSSCGACRGLVGSLEPGDFAGRARRPGIDHDRRSAAESDSSAAPFGVGARRLDSNAENGVSTPPGLRCRLRPLPPRRRAACDAGRTSVVQVGRIGVDRREVVDRSRAPASASDSGFCGKPLSSSSAALTARAGD